MFSKKNLRKIIIPLIIEQTLMLSIGMFDTLMVSSVGESAVSGVSLVDTINTLIIYLLTALATGGAIVAGQYLGSKNSEKSNLAGKQLLIVSLGISVLFMMICLIFNNRLLSLFFGNIEYDVMRNARTYFYITALSFPFIAIYSSSVALFRAMGDTKTAMINSLIMNVINIGINALLIYGLKLGVLGAGLGTLTARIIGATTTMFMLRNPKLAISIRSYSFWDVNLDTIKNILKISIPASLENSVFQIGRIILTSLIAVFGTSAITANAVTGSLINVATIPGQALGLAITTVVAQCVGAKEFEHATLYTKYLLKLSWFYMIILNLGILILLNPILNLYNLSSITFYLAFTIMIIHISGWMTIWPMSFALPNALRASGDVKYPMIISIFSMFVFRIGCSYLLVYIVGIGVLSVFIAMLMDWIFRSICFLWRWRSEKWKEHAVD
ncbi:TPA: MATE family efflux transporter [Clostridioides difficile]|nr:MATE family efflux transporter [Clostridioides difficile]HBF4062116.1 MATE family efflux transporter [Clostridioides difficile]